MNKNVHLLIVCCFVLINVKLYAQPGSLDLSFNGTGKVTTKVPGKPAGHFYDGIVKALALQTDGKIIIGGTAGNRFLTGRYNTNGTVDTSYTHIGFRFDQISDRESGTPSAGGVAVQKDGKIVLGGSTTNGGDDESFRLLRYFPDGSTDFTDRITNFGRYSSGQAVALLSDQTIIQAGLPGFLIVKFKTNGLLDSSFGTNGRVVLNIGDAFAVAVEPNDDILVAGSYNDEFEGSADIAVVKFKRDGKPDSSFGVNGIAVTDLHGDEYASAVKILPDGKIVAAGTTTDSSGINKFFAVRYLANGKIDKSFGTKGTVITGFDSPSTFCNAMEVYNNKIVLGGSTYVDGNSDFALVQYNMNGTLDKSFGTNGKVTTDFGKDEFAYAMVVENNGKIVLGGYTTLYNSNPKNPVSYAVALARYNGSAADSTTDSVSVCYANLPYVLNGNSYDTSGTYLVYFTATNGSVSVVKLLLTILSPGFKATLVASDTSICPGKYAALTARVTKGVSPYEYSIDSGTTYQSLNRFKVRPGTYKEFVRDANGCIAVTNPVTITKSTSRTTIAASGLNERVSDEQ